MQRTPRRPFALAIVLSAACGAVRAQNAAPPQAPPERAQSLTEIERQLTELQRQIEVLRGADPASGQLPDAAHGGPGTRGEQGHDQHGHGLPQHPRLRSYRSDSSAHSDDWFHDTEANLADGLTMGAYIDVLFQAVDDTDDPAANRAFLREFEVGLGAQLTDSLEGVAVVAFNEVFEEVAPDATERGLEIDVEEAYLRQRWWDRRISLRLGKLRNDFGRNNRRHTHDLNEVTRPVVIESWFNEEGLLTTGAELNLTLDDGGQDSCYGDLSATLFDPDAGSETPLFGGTGAEGPGVGARGMIGRNVLGGPLELGGSWLHFASGTASGDTAEILGVDLAWEPGHVAVEGEWLWFSGELPGVTGAPRNAAGGYLSVSCSPIDNWALGVRVDQVDMLGVGDTEAGEMQRSLSGVVSWYPASNLRVRAELQHVDIDAAPGGGDPDSRELRFFLGFTLGLGAAHVHGVGHSHGH